MQWPTLPQKVLQNAEEFGEKPALSQRKESGETETLTWSEYADYVMDISRSLIALGHQEGDRLSIYSFNRKEWFACYAASYFTNGAAVGVYHTCSPDEVEWIVGDSGSKFVFVGHNPQWGKDPDKLPRNRLSKILDSLPEVEHVIMLEDEEKMDHPKAMSWEEFLSKGSEVEASTVEERIANITPDSTASLIYTSGTTGNPKGVELTHDNFAFITNQVVDLIVPLDRHDNYISWLPQAHSFGQVCDNHAFTVMGLNMTTVRNPLDIIDYAKEIQPDFFVGVPRIYEKVYSNVRAAIDSKPVIRIGLQVPLLKAVLAKAIRRKAGFLNCKHAITGAAPINPEIIQLFHSIGINIYEAYGLTETTAGMTFNWKGNNKTGSIGVPCPGTEVRIEDDGELSFKGRNIMKGYYNNPEATAETMTEDGWLKSGDLGREDSQGYVSVTGRIKEIYVSSAGKNIAPLVIEETMKSIPLVSQCMLIGDNRKYCSALFTLDVSVILRDKHGMDGAKVPKDPAEQLAKLKEFGHELSEYTDSPEIYAEIQEHVDRLNGQFSNPEQLKKFTILPRDLSVDHGELTPTLKIRRIQIRENWADKIEAMYSGA